jgi:hypothetical protein
MMRNGCKPFTMNTFRSDAKNFMSMGTSSGTTPSMKKEKMVTQKPTKEKIALSRYQKGKKEEYED